MPFSYSRAAFLVVFMIIAIFPVGAVSAGSGADAPTDDVCLDDTCASMQRQPKPTSAAHHSTGPAGSGGDPVMDDVSFDDGISLMQKKLGLMTSTNRRTQATGQGGVIAVQKVIQLLDGEASRVKQEMNEERVQFAAFEKFCTSTAAEKEKQIKDDQAQDAKARKTENDKYIADLNLDCKTRKEDFDTRQSAGQQEIEAFMKAIAIVSSSAVSGAGGKHLPGENPSQLEILTSDDAKALFNKAIKAGKEIDLPQVLQAIDEMIWELEREDINDEIHRDFCKNRYAQLQTHEQISILNAQIASMNDKLAILTTRANKKTSSDLENDISKLREEIRSTRNLKRDIRIQEFPSRDCPWIISSFKDRRETRKLKLHALREFKSQLAQLVPR